MKKPKNMDKIRQGNAAHNRERAEAKRKMLDLIVELVAAGYDSLEMLQAGVRVKTGQTVNRTTINSYTLLVEDDGRIKKRMVKVNGGRGARYYIGEKRENPTLSYPDELKLMFGYNTQPSEPSGGKVYLVDGFGHPSSGISCAWVKSGIQSSMEMAF